MSHLITRDTENRERITLNANNTDGAYIIDPNSVYISTVKMNGMWQTIKGAKGVQAMIINSSKKYGAENAVIGMARLHQILYGINNAKVHCDIICPRDKLYIRDSKGNATPFTETADMEDIYMVDMEIISGDKYPPTALSVTITEKVE